MATRRGCGHGAEKSMPSPSRNVRTSRTVIGRWAGTVSPSIAPRPSTSTRRAASSGRRSSIGCSKRRRHSSTSSSAPTATIGFVMEAMRKMESRRTGSGWPLVSAPATPTSTSSARAASQATPPRLPRSTWSVMTARRRSRRVGPNPLT